MPAIHDWEVEDYLHESVSIDRSDINSEFVRVSSDLAYWGEKLAQAEERHAMDKAALEAGEADLYRKARVVLAARAEAEVEGTKNKPGRVTEDMVKAEVKASDAYRTLQADLIESDANKTRTKLIIEAVKTKRDMLVSLGAQMRAERRGDPQINEDESSLWTYPTQGNDQ